MALVVTCLPVKEIQEGQMWVESLGWEDTLEKEMATHSSIFAWRIPWTEEPDRLQFTVSQESDTTEVIEMDMYLGWKGLSLIWKAALSKWSRAIQYKYSVGAYLILNF